MKFLGNRTSGQGFAKRNFGANKLQLLLKLVREPQNTPSDRLIGVELPAKPKITFPTMSSSEAFQPHPRPSYRRLHHLRPLPRLLSLQDHL